MVKVFLVEDEIVMREGIKNNIDWTKEGYEFVGEASDGELAYPLIQSTKPDILITDIRMPFMNGLELSRLVKQEFPNIKIIVLSGFDEFEYAKEAINIGITEYLVKPISSAALLEAVNRVKSIIEEEQEQKQYYIDYKKEQFESEKIARQNFFGRLVSGNHPVSELLNEGNKINLDLVATQYNILLFQLFTNLESQGYSAEINMMTAKLEKIVEKYPEVVMIERGAEGIAFIFKNSEEKRIDEIISPFIEEVKQEVEKESKLEYFGGLGVTVERLSDLKRCFEKANHAYAYRYLREGSAIILEEDVKQETVVDDDLELSSLNVKKLEKKILERFINTGLKSEVSDFVDEYFDTLGKKNIQSMLFRQYVTMDMYIITAAMLEEIGYEPQELVERCGDFKTMAPVFVTVEETKKYIKTVIETAIELREAVSKKKYSILLKDAQEYIQQNFQNENISLNTVAASVNLSPNHFSTIFSQEVGQTFIEYLTSVRMEKAKELLRNSNMRTAEIAFAVGYRDSHYFSYIFKKTQECTPREYRTRG